MRVMRGQVRDNRRIGEKRVNMKKLDALWPVHDAVYCDRCGLHKQRTCMEINRPVHSVCGKFFP